MMTSIIDKDGMFCFLDDESLKKIDSMYSITINNPELAFVQFAMALGKNIAEDYVGADLKGYPLYGQDLSSVNLNGADLSNSDLRRAKGYNQPRVILDGAILDGSEGEKKEKQINLYSRNLWINNQLGALKIKETVKIVADGLCRAFSAHAQRAYNVEGAFLFNDQSPDFDAYVEKYYQEIDKFKQNNEMSKIQIANRCKRAAAFILASEDRDLLSKLFAIKSLKHNDFVEMFYAHFTYSLCCAFLELDRLRIPKDVEHHFIYNILKERGNASFACLTLTMRAFADAYGDMVEPAPGDDVP